MCTLICTFRAFPRWPLIVAANRDERLDRPAAPPELWRGDPPFIAPRDEAAGGTWLGLNSAGLFVGVTNRFGVPRDDRRASRGTLVTQALRSHSASALHQALKSTPAHWFNAFHLFYADRSAAYVTWSDSEKMTQEQLAPGLHIVTERSLGSDDRARTELIRSRWAQFGGAEPTENGLAELLRIHSEDAVGGTCIHAPALNYGTRSSLILFVGEVLNDTRLLWAEGHPCTAPYASQESLVRTLSDHSARA